MITLFFNIMQEGESIYIVFQLGSLTHSAYQCDVT